MAKKPQNNAAMFGARSFKELLVASTKRGDILFALGIILMLVILILPMPAWLLDIALALSITMACIVLMTAIFIEKPTEFSAFPLVLLITTMYRLSLNLASTRLILSRGYLGPDAALYSREATVRDCSWIAVEALTEPRRVTAKIRHSRQDCPATVEPLEGGRVRILFDEAQRACAPGQSAVFYEGDAVLGGGFLE